MNGLAICAGVGMLDEGIRAGCEFLGIDYTTAAYIEREAYAASQLVARMEDACLDKAPVWSDLTTFNGIPWRGKVDCIPAGFPCQPHSVAGKRGGLEDDRWIWPDIDRIICEVEPSLVWLENVPGLVSTGALEQVLFDLARLGFDVEWGVLAASQVGASHQRERIFILAYRRLQHLKLFQRQVRHESTRESGELGNAGFDDGSWRLSEKRQQPGFRRRTWSQSPSPRCKLAITPNIGCKWCKVAGWEKIAGAQYTDDPLEHTQSVRGGTLRPGDGQRASTESSGAIEQLADSISAGYEGGEPRRSSEQRHGKTAHGPASQLREVCLFAPSPVSERWPGIVANQPHLKPAIEPELRLLADGLALVVDEFRADQLRAIGNGVVPLQAAAAFVLLARRAGITGDI